MGAWGRLPNMGFVLSTAAFPSASKGQALVCAPRRGQTLDQFCHLADRAGFSLRCHEDYDAHVSRLHAKVSLLPVLVTLFLALSPQDHGLYSGMNAALRCEASPKPPAPFVPLPKPANLALWNSLACPDAGQAAAEGTVNTRFRFNEKPLALK